MSRAQAPAVDAAVYASRRERYMDALGPSACALVRSPPEAVRNGDVHHPYRHSSDLYYLTGFTEPGATLVLRPGADKDRVVLFVRPRDPALEQWNGRRAGVEGAVERYGADVAYPVSELRRRLPELVANCEALHYSLGLDANFDRVVANTIAGLRRSERKGQRPPRMIVDPRTVLHELRLRKAPEELALLRRAADITVEAMTAAMREARPGMGEHELEALVHYV
uniref:aminopeptidase P N-terminal domain-containing protein n=1 Tax=Haliangium sp. TaxID=2663208 RepID=UPI003D11889B